MVKSNLRKNAAKYFVSALFCIMLATCVFMFKTGVNTAAAAENEEPAQTATHVSTTAEFGSDWENSGLGKNGYLLLTSAATDGKSNLAYTNLYGGDGTTSTAFTGWKTDKGNTWLTPSSGSSDIEASAGIDRWAYCARAWRSTNNNPTENAYAQYELYKPGTTENISIRNDGWKIDLCDTSFTLNKISAEDLYVTVYLFVGNGAVSAEAPINVYVYQGAHISPARTNDDALSTFYGDALCNKVVVTKCQSYVTFKLEGTGAFQIVATCGSNDGATAISGTQLPLLGGFFLDSEYSAKSADVMQITTEYGLDWESSGLGKKGYAVLSSEASDNSSNLAYTNLYGGNGATATTLTGWTDNESNSWLTPSSGTTEIVSTAGINKWALGARAWKTGFSSLYMPGTQTSISIRLDGWNNVSPQIYDTALTLNKNSAEDLYVTLFINTADNTQVTSQYPIDIHVFSGAVLAKNTASNLECYGDELTQKTVLTVGGAYVTVKLSGAGAFQIVANRGLDAGGTVIGKQAPFICGFFLDGAFNKGAELSRVSSGLGADWENSSFVFGKNGKVIFAAESDTAGASTKGQIYTDIYEDTSSVSKIQTTINNNFASYSSSIKTATGISDWSYHTRVWRALNDGEAGGTTYTESSLNKLGSSDKIGARFDGIQGQYKEQSVIIKKATADVLYVTVYVYGGETSSKKISEQKPVDVYVYGGATFAATDNADLNVYGKTLCGKAVVTSAGSYVTFKLEGAGAFQIVAACGVDGDGTVVGTVIPFIGGFFLDTNLEAFLYRNISYRVGDGENDAENPVKAALDSSITLKDPTPPAHYDFAGWYTQDDFSEGSKVNGSYTVTDTVTFYAKYTEHQKFTVTYNLFGADNNPSNPETYYINEGIPQLYAPVKEGSTFEGWYLEDSFDNLVTSIPAAYNQNVTLYAKFSADAPLVKSITYVLDGGSNHENNVATFIVGEGRTLFDASKAGYTFKGWYTSADFAENSKVIEISESETEDVTLYAKFELIPAVDDPDDPADDPSGGSGNGDNNGGNNNSGNGENSGNGGGANNNNGNDSEDEPDSTGCNCYSEIGASSGGGLAIILTVIAAAILLKRKKAKSI